MFNHGLTDLIGLIRIIVLDITLAADNAIAIGMAVNRLPLDHKKKALIWGLGTATFIRILFAFIIQYLLQIPGLNFIGGSLLLWVCWEMYQDMKHHHKADHLTVTAPANLGKAIISIIIADISMSLDNVLGVAGAAGNNMGLLGVGIVISVLLMGIAANFIAGLLNRYRWLGWLGLFIILSVALQLLYKGALQIYTISSPFFHSY